MNCATRAALAHRQWQSTAMKKSAFHSRSLPGERFYSLARDERPRLPQCTGRRKFYSRESALGTPLSFLLPAEDGAGVNGHQRFPRLEEGCGGLGVPGLERGGAGLGPHIAMLNGKGEGRTLRGGDGAQPGACSDAWRQDKAQSCFCKAGAPAAKPGTLQLGLGWYKMVAARIRRRITAIGSLKMGQVRTLPVVQLKTLRDTRAE